MHPFRDIAAALKFIALCQDRPVSVLYYAHGLVYRYSHNPQVKLCRTFLTASQAGIRI